MAVLPPDPVYNLRCAEMGAVNSICFHQDERILAGTARGSIFLWDLQTNRSLLHFEVGSDPVTSLLHTDERLISQEKGGRLKYWSMTNTGYVLSHSIDNDHPAFCRIDFIPTKDWLLFPKGENGICISTTSSNQIVQTLTPEAAEGRSLGHIACLRATSISDQWYVMAGYENGDVLTWDLRCNKAITQGKSDEMPMAIDYDPVTNRGVCGGTSDKILFFSYQKPTLDWVVKSEVGIKNAGINCLKIRPDQKVFASGGWDGRIRIFSWKSLRPLAVLIEHKSGGVMDIAYSTGKVSMWNAPIMAAAGADGQITLWDLYN